MYTESWGVKIVSCKLNGSEEWFHVDARLTHLTKRDDLSPPYSKLKFNMIGSSDNGKLLSVLAKGQSLACIDDIGIAHYFANDLELANCGVAELISSACDDIFCRDL